MPITEQHGFIALRNRLREVWNKVAPEIPGAQVGGPLDKVFGETGSLVAIRALVNDLEARVVELESRRPF